MLRKREANRGFSLMELVIVVAIIAALAVLLAPKYFQYVEKSRQRVCYTNISTMTRMAVIARSLGGSSLQNLLTNTLDESYHDGKGGCPSGGVYQIKQTATGEWYIDCTKHGAIPSFGSEFAMEKVILAMKAAGKNTLDSGAMNFDTASSKAINDSLKEDGYNLAAMGAVSWKYEKEYDFFFWTDEDISKKNPGDKVYVLRFNNKTGTYTVWQATVVTNYDPSVGPDSYNILSSAKAMTGYTPSTKDKNPQTYENALAHLRAAQAK